MNKFIRIKEDSLIGGVCTGLSEYFNLPIWLIRILFVLLFSLNASALIIYLFVWILSDEK